MNGRAFRFDFTDDEFRSEVAGANAARTISNNDYSTIVVCDNCDTVFAAFMVRFECGDGFNIRHLAAIVSPITSEVTAVAVGDYDVMTVRLGGAAALLGSSIGGKLDRLLHSAFIVAFARSPADICRTEPFAKSTDPPDFRVSGA